MNLDQIIKQAQHQGPQLVARTVGTPVAHVACILAPPVGAAVELEEGWQPLGVEKDKDGNIILFATKLGLKGELQDAA
jgi:hypothetical protein